MTPIRTLIVDEERLARRRISRLLRAEPDIEVAGECANGQDALAWMLAKRPDLVLLDAQMPGLDGLRAMETDVARPVPVLVFVTAFEGYPPKPYAGQACDYLLKPVDRTRFQEMLRRVRVQLHAVRSGEAHGTISTHNGCGRIAIRTPGRVAIVRTEDIDWIEAADNYLRIHCGPETHVLRETMAAMGKRLPSHRFQRVHRSTIVNIDRIKEMQPRRHGDYQIVLRDGTRLALTRNYLSKLEEALLRA